MAAVEKEDNSEIWKLTCSQICNQSYSGKTIVIHYPSKDYIAGIIVAAVEDGEYEWSEYFKIEHQGKQVDSSIIEPYLIQSNPHKSIKENMVAAQTYAAEHKGYYFCIQTKHFIHHPDDCVMYHSHSKQLLEGYRFGRRLINGYAGDVSINRHNRVVDGILEIWVDGKEVSPASLFNDWTVHHLHSSEHHIFR